MVSDINREKKQNIQCTGLGTDAARGREGKDQRGDNE